MIVRKEKSSLFDFRVQELLEAHSLIKYQLYTRENINLIGRTFGCPCVNVVEEPRSDTFTPFILFDI